MEEKNLLLWNIAKYKHGEISGKEMEAAVDAYSESLTAAKPLVMRPLPPEKVDELIKSIPVNQLNLEHIAKHGRINGSLLVDLRLIINKAIQAAMSS